MLPLVVAHPAPIILALIVFGVLHALIYRWHAPAWPAGIMARSWRMAALVFVLSFAFWEFFAPYNQLGEPIALIGLELLFWAAIALADGTCIAAVFEWRGSATQVAGARE